MKKIIFLSTITVLTIISSYFIYRDLLNIGGDTSPTSSGGSSQPVSTSTDSNLVEIVPGVVGEFVETTTSTKTLPPLTFSIDRPIVFPANSLSEISKKTEAEIKKLVDSLKKDQGNFDNWIDLGIYRKAIEDYEGAKEAWEYAILLRPSDPLPYSNLGNLYGYYLKDKQKAEDFYLKSLEKGKDFGFWYYQAFLFYKEVMEDDIKAKKVLEEGVKNDPTDLELRNILNSL